MKKEHTCKLHTYLNGLYFNSTWICLKQKYQRGFDSHRLQMYDRQPGVMELFETLVCL